MCVTQLLWFLIMYVCYTIVVIPDHVCVLYNFLIPDNCLGNFHWIFVSLQCAKISRTLKVFTKCV